MAREKELGYDAIALTDHAGLYGAVEFYEAAKKEGAPWLGRSLVSGSERQIARRRSSVFLRAAGVGYAMTSG